MKIDQQLVKMRKRNVGKMAIRAPIKRGLGIADTQR